MASNFLYDNIDDDEDIYDPEVRCQSRAEVPSLYVFGDVNPDEKRAYSMYHFVGDGKSKSPSSFLQQRTARTRPDGGSGAMTNNESGSSTNDDESTSAMSREPNYENQFSRKRELRILLIGKTGNGKSATGNTILGKRVFKSKASAGSVTKKSTRQESYLSERKLVVVDTPGLFDTDLSLEETALEIGHCIAKSSPGPHAIVLVLQVGRFTQEEEDAVEKLQDIFGKKAMEYMIILFTRKDDLENETIQDYVENLKESYLKKLIKMCGDRYCAFNNKLKEEMRLEQVSKLINMIDTMVSKNEGRCYTNELYAQAEEILRQKEAERMEIDKEHQKEIQKLKDKYERSIKELRKELEEKENKVRKEMETKHQEMNDKYERSKQETEERIRNLERELQRKNEQFQPGDANREIYEYGIKEIRKLFQEMKIISPIEMKKSEDQIQSNECLNHIKNALENLEKIISIEKRKSEQSKNFKEASENATGEKIGKKKGKIFQKLKIWRT